MVSYGMTIESVLKSNAAMDNFILGVTTLESNVPVDEACIGEYITFNCTTTDYSLRWTVTTQRSTIRPKTVSFRSDDPLGNPINIREGELDLQFELASFVANPVTLTSILVARASAVLNHGIIDCRATSLQTLVVRLLSGEHMAACPSIIPLMYSIYYNIIVSANCSFSW